MNTIPCTKCGVQFAKSRPKCPGCGHPNATADHVGGALLFFAAVLVVAGIWGMATKSYLEMFGLIASAMVVSVVVGSRTSAKQRNNMEKKLEELPNFVVSHKMLGNSGSTGLAIDERAKKVCLIDNRYEIPEFRIISYKEIISCELFEDGSTVAKTVRSSQIGGALVGGLVFGGVGAILGGLSGNTKTTERVNRIDLRIVVNDIKNPVHDVNFLSSETSKDGGYYQSSLQQARHLQGVIEVLIRQADADDKQVDAQVAQGVTKSSLADEIRKLADLRDSGALTDEEFNSQKKKLLS